MVWGDPRSDAGFQPRLIAQQTLPGIWRWSCHSSATFFVLNLKDGDEPNLALTCSFAHTAVAGAVVDLQGLLRQG